MEKLNKGLSIVLEKYRYQYLYNLIFITISLFGSILTLSSFESLYAQSKQRSKGDLDVKVSSSDKSKTGFSQIVLEFKEDKNYNYFLDENNNCLVLSFKNTTSSEIPEFGTYDPKLISKVLIKEYVASSTDVMIYFKNEDVEVTVYELHSPFRVVVDSYNKKLLDSSSTKVSDVTSESEYKLGSSLSDKNQDDLLDNNKLSDYSLILNKPGNTKRHTSYEKFKNMISRYPQGSKQVTEFPRYVYRFEPVDENLKYKPLEELESKPNTTLTSKIVADYARYLYQRGDEYQALAALGYLVKIDPVYVNSNVDLIWIIAESTFRGGNESVAGGYYDIILTNKDNSKETKEKSALSCLRKTDFLMIKKHLPQAKSKFQECQNRFDVLKLGKDFDQNTNTDSKYDFKSYSLIRSSYLNDNKNTVPVVDYNTYKKLLSLESGYIPKHLLFSKDMDRFLTSSLILNYILESNWKTTNTKFVSSYFKVFASEIYEPEYSYLKDKLKQRLVSDFSSLYKESKYLDLVNMYEGLDKSLQSISKTDNLAWMLAESYRYLGKDLQASGFYNQSVKSASGIDKFKASFRELTSKASVQKTGLADLDGATFNIWSSLSNKDKNKLGISMKQEFVNSIVKDAHVKSSALLYLELWKASLEKGTGPYVEDTSTIKDLTTLATKFEKLGLRPERKQTLELLLKLKNDSNFTKSEDLHQDLVNLADEFRKDKEFEQAANSYIKVARLSDTGKSSFLYKGALMYLQAGMNKEALSVLEECSSDDTDKYYLALCKERIQKMKE